MKCIIFLTFPTQLFRVFGLQQVLRDMFSDDPLSDEEEQQQYLYSDGGLVYKTAKEEERREVQAAEKVAEVMALKPPLQLEETAENALNKAK